MDRKRWGKWINFPSWSCSQCWNGSLRLLPATLQTTTSRTERLERDDPHYNHHEFLDRFVALLKCDNPACEETGTIAGNRHQHWLPDGTEDGYTDISYQVFSVVPSPLPFKLGSRVPQAVADRMREASALFWQDATAAANRAREAIGAILTDLGIETHSENKRRLNLHQRIEKLRARTDRTWGEQADLIEAIKWIGNEGTHETVSREEVLDAFELLETVIEDIYHRSRHELLARAQATNAKYRR